MEKLSHELFEAFQNLLNRLSPENLSCDGELSRTQINSRYRQIMREWKDLEKKAGRKVTEDEMEKAWVEYLHSDEFKAKVLQEEKEYQDRLKRVHVQDGLPPDIEKAVVDGGERCVKLMDDHLKSLKGKPIIDIEEQVKYILE